MKKRLKIGRFIKNAVKEKIEKEELLEDSVEIMRLQHYKKSGKTIEKYRRKKEDIKKTNNYTTC